MTGPAPSEHAAARFLPERARQGLALCLSGGGFRAALFHLGALRRLNELGILSTVDTISAVSGGSILAAHLAAVLRPWPAAGTVVSDWDGRVVAPFRRVAARNLRTPAILRRFLPWNWFRASTGVRALARTYERVLTSARLVELPARPAFIFCSTDMAFGVNWTFGRASVGDYQLGHTAPPSDWSVGRAVAASSAFPPVFNPLPIDVPPDRLTNGAAGDDARARRARKDVRLTDGGLYDNLGLEPVWKSHATVLVSDGGATFDPEPDGGLLWRLKRYPTVQGQQVVALRSRWLVSNFIAGTLRGTYWGVGSAVQNYGLPGARGYSKPLVTDVIAEVRTDLDAFSTAEMDVLDNHGYLLAAAGIERYASALVQHAPAPAATPPHPALMDEAAVRVALKTSAKRNLLGRGWP